jgi:mannose-1-phosphate guanylyltransferase
MNNNFYILLLCGGSGTRLWPISREGMPKQFHKLASDKSLLRETFERVNTLVPKENIYVSLGISNLEETQKQLKEVPLNNYIIEPIARNTAPAVAYATAKIIARNPMAIIGVISSDHTVKKVNNYRRTFNKAFNFVSDNPNYLVTIGIKPDAPQTGYGYINTGGKLNDPGVLEVKKFIEKPNRETAEKYISSGKYLWNAGYFIFQASELIKMFEKYCPEIFAGIKKIMPVIDSGKEKNEVNIAFKNFPKIPIDIAIAEKAEKIAVIPADLGWSDVGSWSSLYDLLCDKKAETVVSRGHHIGVGDSNCLFFAEDKLLATVGLENIVIVDTPDATLVCNKEKAQEIKSLIEKLKEEGKSIYL